MPYIGKYILNIQKNGIAKNKVQDEKSLTVNESM